MQNCSTLDCQRRTSGVQRWLQKLSPLLQGGYKSLWDEHLLVRIAFLADGWHQRRQLDFTTLHKTLSRELPNNHFGS